MREIPFYKPTITERESELIEEALHSENATDTVAKFEEKLKEYFGAKFVVTTNNIAAAHHLALSAMDTKRGDKVICSVNAFLAWLRLLDILMLSLSLLISMKRTLTSAQKPLKRC